MKFRPVSLLVLCLLLAACNLPLSIPSTSEQHAIDTIVASTVQALTQQAEASPQQPLATLTESFTPSITPTLTPNVTNTPEPGFGSISGGIFGYPYGSIPQLAIVAHEQNPPWHYWYLIIPAGSTYFSMDGYISTGRYQVVAYDYSGHSGGCTTIVEVKNNEMVTCDITNWGGGYPPKPGGVP